MIIDTSAIVAILFNEPEAEFLAASISQSAERLVAAPTILEATMAVSRSERNAARLVADFIDAFQIEVVAFTAKHAEHAYRAFERYGKGRHPAGLNFGDCITYATAEIARQSICYLGNDFAQTDLG